jgi:hypothetical protein
MADEKDAQFEETKWWIDRGPLKEREKATAPAKGIVEQWATELLRGYNQDLAIKNLVEINAKLLASLSVPAGEWGYYSLDIGAYPPDKLKRIKSALPLPPGARAIMIDAGYSLRVVITGDPVGERYVDINFNEAPSLDLWIKGQLVDEQVYPNVGEALKRIRPRLVNYLNPHSAG